MLDVLISLSRFTVPLLPAPLNRICLSYGFDFQKDGALFLLHNKLAAALSSNCPASSI